MIRYEYGNPESSNVLVQMVGEHEVAGLEKEIALIRQEAGDDFSFIGFPVKDWNKELSPWTAAPVFGKDGFGDGAKDTLAAVLSELKKDDRKHFLGGYSLAGLFALWSGYQTQIDRTRLKAFLLHKINKSRKPYRWRCRCDPGKYIRLITAPQRK